MKWQTVTEQELTLFNRLLRKEPLAVDSVATFSRFAKQRGDSDKLTKFESGVTFEMLRMTREGDRFQFIFREPRMELYLYLNGSDFQWAFGAMGVELLEASILWSIKQAHKADSEEPDADPNFGLF